MTAGQGQRHCRVRRTRPRAPVDPSSLDLPTSSRTLAVRVACLRRPGSAPSGPDRMSLAIGGRGEAPDVVFGPDDLACVIETRLDVTAHHGHFDVAGPHLRMHSGAAFLELQWGVVTTGGHFLLQSGLLLRLPTFVVGSAPTHGTPGDVLTATLAVSGPDGALRHGVVPAADLSWLLDTDEALTAVTA